MTAVEHAPATANRGWFNSKVFAKLAIRLGAFAAFAGIMIYFALTARGFTSSYNLVNVVEQSTILGFLAFAMTVVFIGTGTDVAIESASITLMRGSLHGVPDAIEISRATVKNIHQNLFGAFIYNSLGIPVAAGLLYPVWGILMSPILAGAAMSLSSVTVVSNANRLRLFKTSQPQVSAEERN